MKTLVWLLFPILAWTFVPAARACDTTFPNKTVVTYNDLRITFAIDRFEYDIGDSVNFFLCIENTGSLPFAHHTVYVPQDAIQMVADSCITPGYPDCWQDAPFLFPWVVGWSDVTSILPPGAAQIYERTWNGRSYRTGELPPADTYVVLGGLHDEQGAITVPPGGARLSIVFRRASGVPVRATTWSGLKTLKPLFR